MYCLHNLGQFSLEGVIFLLGSVGVHSEFLGPVVYEQRAFFVGHAMFFQSPAGPVLKKTVNNVVTKKAKPNAFC